ncbi:MAG: O-antigen ligase family protein [Bacteroidetes bacterium]|nr:O-antigen ligase family protein [Bacteroidota bacterium]
MTRISLLDPSAPWRRYALFAACLLAMLGLCLSVALLSLSFGLLAVVGIVHSDWLHLWRRLRMTPQALPLLLLFLLCLVGICYPALSGLPTGKGAATAPHATAGAPIDTLGVWLDELRIKLPLLFAPLAFALLPGALTARQLRWLALAYCGTLSGVGVGNLIRYVRHKDEIDALILQSKEFPVVTGMFHIYFSLLVAFGIFWAAGYLLDKAQPRLWRWLFGGFTLILFVNLHVVAARTGLAAFWGTLGIVLLRELLLRRKFWLAVGAVLLLAVVPVAAFYGSASLQKRWQNTRTDIAAWEQGKDITHWSVSRRLAAWETALLVGARSPWVGVGPANLELAMDAQYARMPYHIAPGYQVYTHNQYLETWLAYGVPGILLLLWALLGGLRYIARRPLLLAMICTTGIAMLVEAILERQIGVSFFALFIMLLASGPAILPRQTQTTGASVLPQNRS